MEQLSLLQEQDEYEHEESQLSLLESDKKKTYLQVVKENNIVNMPVSEIFNNEKYDEFYAVTYVSSPKFFSKVVKGFIKVEIILGIEDSELLSSFMDGIKKLTDVKERIEFINELDVQVKDKITIDAVDIRFIAKEPIHSKIYILLNSKTKENRVIIGSANLTEKAFVGRQYEDVMIFDNNNELAEIYRTRFKNMVFESVDYVPELCKNKFKEKEYVICTDPDTLAEVLNADFDKNRIKVGTITQEEFNEIKTIPKETKKNIEYTMEKVEKQVDIINMMYKKKQDKFIIKSASELKKQIVAIKTFVSKSNKKEISNDVRQFYNYIEDMNAVCIAKTTEDNTVYESISTSCSVEEIRDSLLTINDFIEAYNTYTIKPDIIIQSKIFEAIMYAFISPFIWKMREDIACQTGSENSRCEFPIYLIIGGTSRSGKSTALEIIGMMLGYNAPYYTKYSEISNSRAVNVATINGMFATENLSPILVDEIADSFFNGKIGEGIIKQTSNDLKGKHPVFIGTTNTEDFNTNQQVLRRIYYLQINNPFREEIRLESFSYQNEVKGRVNNKLFRDFTYRICKLISLGEKIGEMSDCLTVARDIFKDYYAEAGLKLPEWFPEKQFDNDYEAKGKYMWRTYYDKNKDLFKDMRDGNIYVDDKLFKDEKSKGIAINYLGNGCIINQKPILILNTEHFSKYIGIQRKNKFIEKLIKNIRHK